MEERFKVLSIDFDFFQNTTKDALSHYPDGVDVSSEISTIVWGSYYVGPKKEIIESVTLNRGLFCQMLAILSKLRSDIPVKIANSHVHAYDFIHQYRNGKEVAVFNVDLHHDLFNDNPELDCGNWLKHLKDDLPETNIHWIARPISLECYGINDFPVETDFEKIKNIDFDAVFICRSDPWTPPHLDEYFDRMVELCAALFDSTYVENQVLKPRDLSGIIEAEEQIFDELRKRGIKGC